MKQPPRRNVANTDVYDTMQIWRHSYVAEGPLQPTFANITINYMPPDGLK
jgi:hypothetical protein